MPSGPLLVLTCCYTSCSETTCIEPELLEFPSDISGVMGDDILDCADAEGFWLYVDTDGEPGLAWACSECVLGGDGV